MGAWLLHLYLLVITDLLSLSLSLSLSLLGVYVCV
jgi:hypothetical protein